MCALVFKLCLFIWRKYKSAERILFLQPTHIRQTFPDGINKKECIFRLYDYRNRPHRHSGSRWRQRKQGHLFLEKPHRRKSICMATDRFRFGHRLTSRPTSLFLSQVVAYSIYQATGTLYNSIREKSNSRPLFYPLRWQSLVVVVSRDGNKLLSICFQHFVAEERTPREEHRTENQLYRRLLLVRLLIDLITSDSNRFICLKVGKPLYL